MLKTTLTLAEYQRLANQTGTPVNVADDLNLSALGAAGAVGKLATLVKRYVLFRRTIDREAVVRELGALLWFAAFAARAIEVPLEEVARLNLAEANAKWRER